MHKKKLNSCGEIFQRVTPALKKLIEHTCLLIFQSSKENNFCLLDNRIVISKDGSDHSCDSTIVCPCSTGKCALD